MTLLELVELHTNQNVLSGATNKKYYSVVNTFITDTKINQVNKITNQQIINWRDKILSRSSAGNWNDYHRHMRALVQTAVNMKKRPCKPDCVNPHIL